MHINQTLAGITLATVLGACGSSQAPPPTVTAVVVLPDDEPLLSIGQDLQLSVRATTSDGGTLASPTVTWATGDAAVATVSAAGLLRGIADGTATITASVEGTTGSESFRIVDLTGTWTGSEPPDTVNYILTQNGTSVTGMFQSLLGFPPITNVMDGTLTGSLQFERYEHTLALTTEMGCEVTITGAHVIGVQLDGELVLAPSGTGTLSSSNCAIMGTINFTTLRR